MRKGIVSRSGRILLSIPIVGVILCLVLMSGSLYSQTQVPNEYQVKAAFIYNFAKFIEWPPGTFSSKEMPFILGVMGDEFISRTIEQAIQGKTVNGRQLQIKRLELGQELKICQVLYISSYEQRHLVQILESLRGSSTLTIGEMDRFIQQGGIINLVTEENRVLFEVNLEVAEQAQLKISSKLLVLARTVRGGQRARPR
ncbi:MAG TPA: YfiR family protein [Blastocatellia bacterium]|nr:YfiR family protein [Blastocatellia bacterium]